MLKQSFIDNHSIKLNQQVSSWQEAIKIGTDMLEQSGAITEQYYPSIIESINQLGAYIVLAPGLAMPHSRPENGVKRTAFALVTLQNPICIADSDEPISVLITLAGVDAQEHMEGIMQITQLFEDPDSDIGVNLTPILHCKTEEDVYALIDRTLNQQEGEQK